MLQINRKPHRASACLALMALALLIRVVSASGINVATAGLFGAPARAAEAVPVGVADTAPAAPSAPPEAEILPPEPPQTPIASSPVTFSTEEAAGLSITGACTYSVDKQALLTAPLPLAAASGGAQVLIIHTHTTEAYTAQPGWEYDATDPQRTKDAHYNMVRVGEEIAARLRAAGIGVVHDTALHDYPSYNGAYARTLTDMEADLAANPTIRMVLDVHRDAMDDGAGGNAATAETYDGVSTARAMLVVGTDEGGLSHPNWQDNLNCALKLGALLQRQTPGILRGIDLRTERFNQHTSPGALLLEIGASGDTLAQALACADAVADSLVTLLTMAQPQE
ncbi:MAG: stage II sporulation protein P [Oscillospiraceae bacterium]|nr:stage II sporulation protein P [Oscillospiraceae bacterium]